jgi:hypothetical protein
MSVIQKFSIEKINKIRKILLLYIDKEIKSKNKINHLNCLTERFSGKDLIYQNAYSTPINLEQKFSNEEDQNNINQSQIEFNQNSYSFKTINSFNSNLTYNNIEENIKKITNINVFVNGNFQMKNEMKHISKFEKNYIIVKDDILRLTGKINCINYLINLYRGLKCSSKKRKCLSSIKIKKINNEESKKETILEVKKKQKKSNKKRRNNSVIYLNDNANDIKKTKRKSLFHK